MGIEAIANGCPRGSRKPERQVFRVVAAHVVPAAPISFESAANWIESSTEPEPNARRPGAYVAPARFGGGSNRGFSGQRARAARAWPSRRLRGVRSSSGRACGVLRGAADGAL
eukprot:5943713-Prymnesium_polylepis.1